MKASFFHVNSRFQKEKKLQRNVTLTLKAMSISLQLSMVLIYRRCICDVATGTAWATSQTNENIRRW